MIKEELYPGVIVAVAGSNTQRKFVGYHGKLGVQGSSVVLDPVDGESTYVEKSDISWHPDCYKQNCDIVYKWCMDMVRENVKRSEWWHNMAQRYLEEKVGLR